MTGLRALLVILALSLFLLTGCSPDEPVTGDFGAGTVIEVRDDGRYLFERTGHPEERYIVENSHYTEVGVGARITVSFDDVDGDLFTDKVTIQEVLSEDRYNEIRKNHGLPPEEPYLPPFVPTTANS